MIKFILPFPPTVNSKYGINKITGKRYNLNAVKEWKRQATDALNEQNILPALGRVILEYELDTPDGKERDCANYEKFTTDFLVQRGILKGDSRRHVRGIFTYWNDTPGNKITITINEFKKAEQGKAPIQGNQLL